MKIVKMLVLLLFMIISCNQAYCNEIDNAILKLESIHENRVLNVLNGKNCTKRKVNIYFIDNYYLPKNILAFTNINDDNTFSIYINRKLKNCVPEALACIIAHESIHVNDGKFVTKTEEVQAFMLEVEIWGKFIELKPELINVENDELVTRENRLLILSNTKDGIKDCVYSNSVYQDLKE